MADTVVSDMVSYVIYTYLPIYVWSIKIHLHDAEASWTIWKVK